jgi:uncharacterized protein YqeY
VVTEASLRRDLQAAMKRRDAVTVDVLRGLLAAAANRRIELGVAALGEADLLALAQREMRKREEAEAFARRAGRPELVERNAAERAILEGYLPRTLDEAELTAALGAWVAEGVRAIGPLMARLKERYPGRYDGKRASEIARALLVGD